MGKAGTLVPSPQRGLRRDQQSREGGRGEGRKGREEERLRHLQSSVPPAARGLRPPAGRAAGLEGAGKALGAAFQQAEGDFLPCQWWTNI